MQGDYGMIEEVILNDEGKNKDRGKNILCYRSNMCKGF